MKKIIFLEAVQDHGGARKSTLELADRLRMNGLQILVIDFYGTNLDFLTDVHDRGLELKVLKKRDNPFILQNSNPFKYLANMSKFYFELKQLKAAFRKCVEEFNPNFVVVNNRKTLLLTSKGAAYKTIFFARGWFLPSQISKLDYLLMKKKVDLYMAVSQATRHALFCNRLQSLNNIHVVKNGISIDKLIQLNNKNSLFTIIHSGGFLYDKGQHICVEIARRLKELKVEFKLILTGKVYNEIESKKYFEEIIALIDSYSLNDSIELIVNKNYILNEIGKAHVLVHPSYTEGLPRVLMEAMALHTVVIANPVGGVTDFVLDGFTGYLTSFNSIEDYTHKIRSLYENVDERNMIADNAFQLISNHYDPNIQVKEFIKALNEK